MTTSRMNKLVTNYYVKDKKLTLTAKPTENVRVAHSKLKNVNGFCKSTYKKFYTIPLIFYYYSYERIQCEINPKLLTQQFQVELSKWLDQEDNKAKLNGGSLDVQFTALPHNIHHRYISHYVPLYGRYSTSFQVIRNVFMSDSGTVALTCEIKDRSGAVVKNMSIDRRLKAVNMDTYFTGRRKHFILQGMEVMSVEYETTFRELIQSILEEI